MPKTYLILDLVALVQIEDELGGICHSILGLLDEHLIPTATSGESKVFYLKMKGDYHRYLAEFRVGQDRKDEAEQTYLAYKAAQVHVSCLKNHLSRMIKRLTVRRQLMCKRTFLQGTSCAL